RDLESVLAQYDIEDKATLRQILGELAQLDMLDGNYEAALARVAQVKALEDKPADKLLSGITTRAIVAGVHASPDRTSAAYRTAVAQSIKSELATMPYDMIANQAKEIKAGTELLGEGRLIGNVREVLQPSVDKNGSLSSDLAPTLVRIKYTYRYILPLKPALTDAWATYLAAHKVDKPDIWAARAVTLPAGGKYSPVKIAVWDSGVDTKLFPNNLAAANGSVPVIAFDRFSEPAKGELQQIPDALKSKVPQLKSYLKGFSDLQSNIDSPEASEIKSYMSTLKPEEYKAFVEEIGLAGNWMHGTHVAGIAVAGNPYARLLVGRIEFDWHLIPDPCPTRELTLRDAKNAQSYADFFKQQGARVVNMSWGGSVKGIEDALELCNIGKTPDERKAIARDYFDIQKDALTKAFASAPEILFVTAAGNSNQDASFVEDIPADIVLPNLLTVGAVDKAGDEASFTSYGPTVKVHANGYQVESVIPGGEKLAESGTSMASPQVVNLAAKILAVNPTLMPNQVIALIRDNADKTPDGRRTLINPKKTLAAVQAGKTG
ncbi:MAG TPA: S8 family serine peptidase, partial [Casimicrobiaceae bacterium]|nr:S8 family serine peptidase [Casimicrobiaceae bacterium]